MNIVLIFVIFIFLGSDMIEFCSIISQDVRQGSPGSLFELFFNQLSGLISFSNLAILIIFMLVFGSLDVLAHLGLAFAAFLVPFFVLSTLFKKYIARYRQSWLAAIYRIGIALTVLFTYLFYDSLLYARTPQGEIFDSFPIGDYLFGTITGVTSLVLISSLACRIIAAILDKRHRGPNLKPSSKGKSLKKHYQQAGLSDEEIDYFRSQMALARDSIKAIEANMNETAKLRAVNTREMTVVTSQHYFKHIVQNPNRLADASHFLYKILPSLEDLTSKYNEINSHIAKNKQSYLILEKTAQMVRRLSEELKEDYIRFHEDTFKEADDELKYAETILRKTSKAGEDIQEDSLDTLLDELNDFD